MKTIFLILSLILLLNHSFSQQNPIDSLQHLLKTAKQDTNKVNLLNDLSREFYLIGDYDKEMNYGKQAFSLSKHIGYKKGIANSINNIAGAFGDKGNYGLAFKNGRHS